MNEALSTLGTLLIVLAVWWLFIRLPFHLGPEGPAEQRRRFLETYPCLSAREVADRAGFSARNPAALAQQWEAEGRIFSVYHGAMVYPAFQFGPDGEPLPEIESVVAARGRDGWELAFWFTTPSEELEGKRPVEMLGQAERSLVESAG